MGLERDADDIEELLEDHPKKFHLSHRDRE